jgi:hypothetical protein
MWGLAFGLGFRIVLIVGLGTDLGLGLRTALGNGNGSRRAWIIVSGRSSAGGRKSGVANSSKCASMDITSASRKILCIRAAEFKVLNRSLAAAMQGIIRS